MITLALEFHDSGKRFDFNPIAYDRSGRLGIDRVVVAPAADVDDPSHDYDRPGGRLHRRGRLRAAGGVALIGRWWMRGVAIMAMVASADLASVTATQEGTSRRLVVDVDDPRPLSAAARQLERQLGMAVTFEDGSYVAPEDIVDVTAKVRRDGLTEPRVLVMRGGAFRFENGIPGTAGAGGVHQLLSRLVETWNQSGIGGTFSLVDVGAGFHIIPTERRGVTGGLEPCTSPLSAPIDMPAEERTGLDIVTGIARRLSEETGRRIWVGTIPTNLMVQKRVTVGARNESARAVLWRALQQLHPALSWQLLCSVGEQADCALNVHVVPRDYAPRP